MAGIYNIDTHRKNEAFSLRCSNSHTQSFTPTLLAFLTLRFLPLFSVSFGARGGKWNGKVINKNQFSCCLSPFAFSLGKTYGVLLGTAARRRCEEGEIRERCKESGEWNNKIARKYRRFGGNFFVILLFYLLNFTIYVVWSKSFRRDQLFKVTEIKQICYFST
jgi:hypothetical protein